MKKYIVRMLSIYFLVGVIYGGWALAFLQFRTCWAESSCLSAAPLANPSRTFFILAVAVTRGVLWGPNLILSFATERFVDDWLLFRDVAPIALIFGQTEQDELAKLGMLQNWLLECPQAEKHTDKVQKHVAYITQG